MELIEVVHLTILRFYDMSKANQYTMEEIKIQVKMPASLSCIDNSQAIK